MVSLILCILFTLVLGVIFKSIPKRFQISNLIMINYLVCSFIALMKSDHLLTNFKNPSFQIASIILGLLFYVGFTFFGRSVQINGLGMSTAVQKMSIALTVLVALGLGESLNSFQWIGLLFSFVAIYFLILEKEDKNSQEQAKNHWTLLIIWLNAAAIEIAFIIMNKTSILNKPDSHVLSGLVFLGAFIISLGNTIWTGHLFKIKPGELIIGILLGIPNYFSIYFMNLSLESGVPGSILFPVLNCSVLLLSNLIGLIGFQEKLSTHKQWGIVTAILAILLISLKNILN